MKISKSFSALSVLFVVATLVLVVCAITVPHLVHWFTWMILIYFIMMTSGCHFLMNKAVNSKDPYDFYNYAMSTIAIRLLISVVILFIYYYNFKKYLYLFTVTFFIFYFTFTGFEIRLLLSKLRGKGKSSNNTDEKV